MEELHLAALERWIVRELVSQEIRHFIYSPEEPDLNELNSSHLVPILFHQLLTFPPFEQNPKEIHSLLSKLFKLLRNPSADSASTLASTSFSRSFVTPLIAGPLLSACRTNRAPDSQAPNVLAETASRILLDMCQTEDGLDNFLEEVKSAHAISELNSNVQTWFIHCESLIVDFFQTGLWVQYQKSIDQLPRKTLLAMLKSHTASSVSSFMLKFLFLRPPSSEHSFFSQMVSDTLRVKETKEALSKLDPVENQEEFLRLQVQNQRNAHVLSLCHDENILALLQSFLQLTKQHTVDVVFAKGSGLIKLVEELFSLWDRVKEGKTVGREELKPLWVRVLSLAHNILIRDREDEHSLFVRTLHWYFGWFKNVGLHLHLPLEVTIQACSETDQQLLREEAKICFDREEYNMKSRRGSSIPRPKLDTTSRILLAPCLQCLLQAFQRRGHVHPFPSSPRALALNPMLKRELQTLEVMFHYVDDMWPLFSKRRFVTCGKTRSCDIWARFEPGVLPIVEICLSPQEWDSSLLARDFVVIPKNLNKGSVSGDKLFLHYRRRQHEWEEGIRGLEILFEKTDPRKKDALLSFGFRVIARFPSSVFAQSEVWMLGGVNK